MKLPIGTPNLTIGDNSLPTLQRVLQDIQMSLQRISGAFNNTAGFGSFSGLSIGGYVFFIDTDGGLKVRAPDSSVVTLLSSTVIPTASTQPTSTFVTLAIGDFTFYVGSNGSLDIQAPDGSSTTLIGGS